MWIPNKSTVGAVIIISCCSLHFANGGFASSGWSLLSSSRFCISQYSSIQRRCIVNTAANSASNISNNRDRIFFDVEVGGNLLGRLVFRLGDPSILPLHTENLKKLITGERRSVDPQAHYVGCTFEYSPDYIEEPEIGIGGRYRWAHILKGRGRNAVGRATEAISDPQQQRLCTYSCFGGQYYGEKYVELENDPGVLLTVPIVGPGRGSSRLSIVRVGESPQEWRERLLLNSAVLGRLEPSGVETLRAMARQKVGPPKVIATGLL